MNTKTKTIQGYKELYTGPDFRIYYQYAFIIIIVWVTFLFGPVIPIVFIIGLIALIFLYITDRLLIAYSYRAPPIYDSRLNTMTL